MSLVETRINVLIVHVNFSYTSSMHRIQTLIKGCTHPFAGVNISQKAGRLLPE